MEKIEFSAGALRQMATTNARRSIQNLDEIKPDPTVKKVDFGDLIAQKIEQVNDAQHEADHSITRFLSGKDESVHQTMLSVEKADIQMRLLVQVRNRAIEAYREILRMNG